MGTDYKIISHDESEKGNTLKVQYMNGKSNNELLSAIMPAAEILAFEELIPSMNDVFIKAVEESNKN